jgi:hypothetical protein
MRQTRRRGARFLVAPAVLLAVLPMTAGAGEPVPLQRLVDEAAPGAVVTVPPGVYSVGARIAKPLTLRMKGAVVRGNVGAKGVLNVAIHGGRVVIEDFTATDGRGCSSGNCAGIRVEGRDFHVTLRRARIANQVMGILTDNRGGTLIVEDSVIENQGHPRSALSHLVYAGAIDRLVIRNSTLRRSRFLGHLLKSRAAETVVENSRLLGLDGRHSRSVDLPCGGRFVLRNSIVQHGRHSDNADLVAIGTEPNVCRDMRAGDVVLENSWIISDRRPVTIDPAKPPARNTLFTWWAAGDNRLRATGNRIVDIERWHGDRSWNVPDLAAGNSVFPDRASAGLGPAEIPSVPAAR